MIITVGAPVRARRSFTRIPWFWVLPAAAGRGPHRDARAHPAPCARDRLQLRDDDLVFRRGIMFQRIVAVPYGRMQLVDINRGPLDRAFGLSELKFVTAAAATGVTIPGLPGRGSRGAARPLVALAESRRAGL